MALSRVQGISNSTINNSTVTMTLAAPPTVGNGIIVAVVSGQVDTVTDNRSNTYTLAKLQLGGSGNAQIWYCPAITGTGSPFIVTVSGATFNHRLGAAIEVNSAITIHQSAAKDAGSSPSLTPFTASTPVLTANEAIVVAVLTEGNNQTTITAESVSPAWTQEGEILGVVFGEIDSRVLTAGLGATQSCSWTVSPNSAGYWTVIVAFKAGTPPAPPTPPAMGKISAGAVTTIPSNTVVALPCTTVTMYTEDTTAYERSLTSDFATIVPVTFNSNGQTVIAGGYIRNKSGASSRAVFKQAKKK